MPRWTSGARERRCLGPALQEHPGGGRRDGGGAGRGSGTTLRDKCLKWAGLGGGRIWAEDWGVASSLGRDIINRGSSVEQRQ